MKVLGAFLLAALLGTACASAQAGREGIVHPTGAPDLVLRIDLQGGFITPQAQLRRLPLLALYGDGRLIVPGPQIEIYPGPALPNLQVRSVSEAGIQAILAAARRAGLLSPDRQYVSGGIADAPTTVFTVVAGGSRHVVSVNALSEGGSRSEAVARIAAFQSKMTDLASWLPHGSLGPEQPYLADELRVYAMPYEGQQDLPQRTKAWPVGGFGGYLPVLDVSGIRCGTVFGVALQKVLTAASTANELTPWKADGKLWTVVFRPLLPDESGCS